jgi:HK97 gp10 family phage protein
MRIDVEVEGVRELREKFRRMLRSAEVDVDRKLEVIASKIEADAARLCPVDTGRLRASITHRVERGRHVAYVGTNVEYAPYVEFGTRKMRAQPFLRPALHKNIPLIRETFRNILRK